MQHLELIDFSDLKTFLHYISIFLGVMGGFFAIWSFIDSYILKFKPKFLIGNIVYFSYKNNDKNYSYLQSIILQFEIFNHRNKLGRIEDVFIQIYDTTQLEPTIVSFFPKYILNSMPTSKDNITETNKSLALPVAVLNKSSRTLVLEMTQHKHDSGTVSNSGILRMIISYKSTNGKWKKIGVFPLMKDSEECSIINDFEIFNFKLSEQDSERDSIKRREISREVNAYKGKSDYYHHLRAWRIKKPYFIAKAMFSIIPMSMKFILDILVAIGRYLISETFKWRIIKNKAAPFSNFNFTTGNPIDAKHTDIFLKNLFHLIQIKVKKINKSVSEDESIKTEIHGQDLLLKNKNIELKIYKSGDGFIGVTQINSSQSSKSSIQGGQKFTIQIKKYAFGWHLWTISGRPAFKTTIATEILDYISLYSRMFR